MHWARSEQRLHLGLINQDALQLGRILQQRCQEAPMRSCKSLICFLAPETGNAHAAQHQQLPAAPMLLHADRHRMQSAASELSLCVSASSLKHVSEDSPPTSSRRLCWLQE